MSETVTPVKTRRSLKLNFIYNFISQITAIIVPFITTPYLARVLHEVGNGQIAYVSSIISYFVLFSTLGFNVYGQREIAKYRDNIKEKSRVFWEIFSIRLITTTIALGILYSVIFTVGFGERYNLLMLIMSFQVVANIFDIQFFFMGEECFSLIALRTILIRLAGLAAVFIFVKSENDTWIYAVCLTASPLLSNFLLWPSLFKRLTKCGRIKPANLLRHLKPVLIIFFPVMVTTIFTTFDKTMIGWLSPSAEIGDYNNGCYEQAYKINNVAQTVVVAFSSVMISRNSVDYSRGDIGSMNRHIYKSFRYVLLTSMFFAVGFLALSENFSAWFYGEGYAEVPLLLKIMSIRLVMAGMSIVLGDRFIVIGKEIRWLASVCVGAIANVAINALLIPGYGAVGAAIATAITEVCIFIAMAVMSFGKAKGLLFSEIAKHVWKYILSAAVSFCGMWGLQYALSYSVWEFVVIGIVGTAIYSLMLLILKDDFFIEILKRFFKETKNFLTRSAEAVKKKFGTRLKNFKQWRAGGVAFFGVKSFLWSKIRYRNMSERLQYKELYLQMMRFKILCGLRKRFRKAADRLQEEIDRTDSSVEHVQSNKIWIFWWQGMENAPKIVQLCYNSVLARFASTHEIIVITEKNYKDYVTMPEFVSGLLEKKKITIQFFSDLLRLELLNRYGGTWMDATVLITDDPPAYMTQSPLFMFQTLFPSTFGNVCRMESWYIHSESNNKILRLTYGLLLEYLRKKSTICDYLLIFDMMELAVERYKKEWQLIPPCSNANSLSLQYRMSWEYDEDEYQTILANAHIHKLDWRYCENNVSEKDTYYSHLIKDFIVQSD